MSEPHTISKEEIKAKQDEAKKHFAERDKYHKKEASEVIKELAADPKNGLTTTEAEKRVEKYGLNELAKKEKESIWEKIKEQFEDLLVRILLGAATISFIIAVTDHQPGTGLSHYVEPFVILVILVLNAAIGVWQDSNAEGALEALMDMQALKCRVIRDGKLQEMDSKYLVPGDLIEIHVGDKVPADARIVELKSVSLQIEEASLTGEAVSVEKIVEKVNTESDILQERKNILFSSTICTYGCARAIVIHTGMDTAIGTI